MSGWPLVKDRMDITGARWGLDGAEAILKLRALISNGDFDQYWVWHSTRNSNVSTTPATRTTSYPTDRHPQEIRTLCHERRWELMCR